MNKMFEQKQLNNENSQITQNLQQLVEVPLTFVSFVTMTGTFSSCLGKYLVIVQKDFCDSYPVMQKTLYNKRSQMNLIR